MRGFLWARYLTFQWKEGQTAEDAVEQQEGCMSYRSFNRSVTSHEFVST